jgi:predicted amidophosphoribosyltransferase
MRALTDLLMPLRCPCGEPAGRHHPRDPAAAVCAACRPLLLGGPVRHVRPYPRPPGLLPCSAAAAYAGRMRRCLIAYKERGRRDLAPVLALALVKVLRELAADTPRPVLLVPVPPSRAALRARGFDHVALLVRLALRLLPPASAAQWGWSPLLYPTRRVADQAGLPAAARARNVAGSLSARPGSGRRVAARSPLFVLVDDVLTTGATMAEATRALGAGGLRTHAAVVVAAVLRPEYRGGSALPSRGKTG